MRMADYRDAVRHVPLSPARALAGHGSAPFIPLPILRSNCFIQVGPNCPSSHSFAISQAQAAEAVVSLDRL